MARGPQWSPSLERKKIEEARKGKKTETRRKTLAELALEAGYTVSIKQTVHLICPLLFLRIGGSVVEWLGRRTSGGCGFKSCSDH